jgi:Flp pilus assembly protein TadG
MRGGSIASNQCVHRWRAAVVRFARERSAVSAIEFAMIAPVLILLVIETLQIGFYFYTSASLNYVTRSAGRQIQVGSVAQQNLTAAQFQNNLCGLLPGTMSCANVITNVFGVPEALSPNGFYAFLNASQTGLAPPLTNNANASFCPGSPGAVVYVQVYYGMPVFSPIWLAIASQSWNGATVHFVLATTAFKNEPYLGNQDSAAGC